MHHHHRTTKKASAQAEAQSCLPVAARRLLGRRGSGHGTVALGVLAAEALDAARGVHQALFAGVEWVANRADFHVYVALWVERVSNVLPQAHLTCTAA